ncbi:MAG: hypothetical protein Q9168_001700 [Polycauliona sp. 1 TL-2023]
MGLAFPGFNNFNTAQGVTAVRAQSPPNVAASVTVAQMLEGQPAMFTTAGTPTNSFALKSLYNDCVVASQTGLLAEGCTIQYTGTKTDGSQVSKSCTFDPKLLSLDNGLALCEFPSSFTKLKSVSVAPVKAALLPASTVVLVDTISGATSS